MVGLVTESFASVARLRAKGMGMNDGPFVFLPHPLADKSPQELDAIAREALPRIVHMLTDPASCAPGRDQASGEKPDDAISLPADPVSVMQTLYDWGWTDGLPIIAPEEGLVERMLEAVNLNGGEALGSMPPRLGKVLASKVAANAVMAGARPEDMPLILTVVRAILRPEFNVGAVASTTGGPAPIIVVNGPIASQLAVANGYDCFSLQHRANAVVARSIKLMIRNIGGAIPGELDRATQGFPGKALCFAEREDANPWEPLHIELGYSSDTSTVSVFPVRCYMQVTENEAAMGDSTVAGSMRAWGQTNYYNQGRYESMALVFGRKPMRGRVLLALSPEHAHELSERYPTKYALKTYLFQQARIRKKDLMDRGNYRGRTWPAEFEAASDDDLIPMVAVPDDIVIVVVGGSGRHFSWFPVWPSAQPVIEVVTRQ